MSVNKPALSYVGLITAMLEIITHISGALSFCVFYVPHTPRGRAADGTDPVRRRVGHVIDRHGASIGGR